MRSLLFIFFLFSFIAIDAQDLLVIRGEVVDAKSGDPIPYAHVGIPKIGIGTTTTNSGAFVLKINPIHKDKTLTVSFIGYENYDKKVANINQFLTIKIEQSATDLQMVEVIDEFSVESIIRKAVAKIPKNYPSKSTSAKGFYRQSRTDKNNEYLYVAEGVLDIYKSTYKKKKAGQIGLEEGRQVVLVDAEVYDDYSGTGSGHMAAHRFDFVKNREDFIDEKYFPVYKYWIENITTYNGRLVYIIAFDVDPDGEVMVESSDAMGLGDGIVGKVVNAFSKFGGKKKKKKYKEKGRMKGRIYIEKESLAFIRAEWEITKEGLKKTNDYPLYGGRWKGNKYVTNYRQLGDTWYFGNALREGITTDDGLYSNDITITEINSGKAVPIDYENRLRRSAAFTNLTGDYEAGFWDNYNTTELDDALAETVEQKTTQTLSNEVFTPERMAAIQAIQDSIRLAEEEAIIAELKEDGKDTKQIEREIKRRKWDNRWQFFVGTGVNLMSSGGDGTVDLGYFRDLESTQPILHLSEQSIASRDFEVPLHMGINIFFKENTFFRYSFTKEFGNAIYRERTFAIGQQLNLSKKRPVNIRLSAGYAPMSYARYVGQATNEYGEFEVDKKNLKSDKINMYYGEKTFNIKGTLEIGVELRPGIQLFAKGSYLYPIASKELLYLWERERFFMSRKKVNVLDADLIDYQLNNEGITSKPNFDNPIFLSIGVVFN